LTGIKNGSYPNLNNSSTTLNLLKMNFFNIIRKGTNKRLEALKDSAIYEIAAEKLEPKTYASQAKPLYSLSQYFSVAYHFISYVVALIGISIYALQLDSVIQKTILILLSFLFLGIIEIAKSNSSNTVFSSLARKENPNKLFLIILLVTTVFSFVTSVWSAKESIYYASTNSKFSNIDSLQNSQIDSINNLFATQISSIESSLKASQNTLQTSKNKWLKIATNKDLQDTQNSLNNVLDRKEKALLSIQNSKTSSYKTTSEKGTEISIFAAVLFSIFEVLNLVCYWFVYQYYQSCLLENNLPNKPNEQPKEQPQIDIESITNAIIKAITNVTQSVTSTVLPNPFSQNLDNPTARNKIGFQYSNEVRNEVRNDSRNTPQNEIKLNEGNRICKNCNKAFVYKTSNHKFCTTECRIQHWNKENNGTFVVGKGGANA
jgi:hypothetical protein